VNLTLLVTGYRELDRKPLTVLVHKRMNTVVGLLTLIILLSLTLLGLYQWLLAVIAIVRREHSPVKANSLPATRFLVLMPAHNEELCLRATLTSLRATRYPGDRAKIVVIADRCTDGTVVIAKEMGVECLDRTTGQPGKGPAIAWALDELSKKGLTFDALVIVDADTVVDPEIFVAFARELAAGHHVQQGYCYISNPWQSTFTRIIAVTSVMRNKLFYAGKNGAGLPAMLAGTGMCFSKRIVDQYGWTSFSVGEDWEFSAALVLAGEKIRFNPSARVFQLESTGLRQASRQRLRWAGGRHAVAGESISKLVKKGLKDRSLYPLDAAVTLVAPNYSSQASLGLIALIGAWFLMGDGMWAWLMPWSLGVLASLGAYFLLGVAYTESPLKALIGVVLIPIFLPWRLVIEIFGLLGFGRKVWFRTSRITTPR
jgi:cellulose synthase/poly-beta-1,6-N-acetylglucosamine synthase-like glycosyltransferase